MSLRLRSQNNSKKTLSMSGEAWFGILGLAETYGWNPMGTALPGEWHGSGAPLGGYDLHDPDIWPGDYTASEGGLVLLEDALNLADALERAFLEFEPERAYKFAGISQKGRVKLLGAPHPGIGAIQAVMDFCRYGAFWIEEHD